MFLTLPWPWLEVGPELRKAGFYDNVHIGYRNESFEIVSFYQYFAGDTCFFLLLILFANE